MSGPSIAFAGNIVVNGSFESPDIGNTWFVTVDSGQTTLTGWSVGQNSIDIVSNLGGHGGAPDWAIDGNQSVDLAGTPGPGSISQILATVSNETYTLSFAVSSNGQQHANGIQVFWDNNLLDTISSPLPATWDIHTYNVTASTSSTPLGFSTPIAGNNGPLLDAVSVTAIPELSTLILLCIGIAGMAGYRLRKRALWRN